MNLLLESFSVGPMDNNLLLLLDPSTRRAVVVDPSLESGAALERALELKREGWVFEAIWNTHGHFDHIADNAIWKRALEVPLWMHQADEMFRARLREQALWFGFTPPEPVAPDQWFTAGQKVAVGSISGQILHLPGHSPGSVAFLFPTEALCISGDVLFAGSVGRTDLPAASVEELAGSLRILFALPPETRIVPGHGPATTVGAEIASNQVAQQILSEE